VILALDEDVNAKYRNPFELGKYIREICDDKSRYFCVLLDEIQKVDSIQNSYLPDNPNENIGFVDVLLGLKEEPNIDLYVTDSNSRMLSMDILTEFKDRGEEIRVNPLTYDEFMSAYQGDSRLAWTEFMMYGGMPFVMHKDGHAEKAAYLQGLFEKTYITDVIESATSLRLTRIFWKICLIILHRQQVALPTPADWRTPLDQQEN